MKCNAQPLPLERPAVFFFLALIAGLLIGDRFPGHLHLLLVGTSAGVVALRIWGSGCVRATLAVAGVFLVLGYLSLQPWVAPGWPPDHVKFSTGRSRGTITGRVDGLPLRAGNRTRFLLEVDAFNQKKTSGNLRVTAVGRIPGIRSGDRLQFQARIKAIRNFNNPGAFDYRRYLMFKKVWASAWVPADKIRVLAKNGAPGFMARLGLVRAALSGWIAGTLQEREGSLITALVTGDRSGITPQLRQQFNCLGLGHLLAISGLHIGIVATVAFGCLHWVCRRVPYLVNTGRSRRSAALFTLFPVTAYGLIAGMSPSTQRAVIMVVVFLLAMILERRQDPFNTLAAAALIILVWHPPALFSVSFQLSFAAVFTILYGLACLPDRWLNPPGQMERQGRPLKIAGRLIAFFWVSCLAIAGTLPLAMHYFNQVSYIGVLTNFVYIPVMGFVAVPVALAATLLYPVSGAAAAWLLEIAGFVVAGAMRLADFLYGFSWIAAHTVTLNWFEVVCVFSLIFTALQLLKCKGRTPPGTVVPSARTRRWAKIGLAAVCILLAGDGLYWMGHRFWHRDLRVTCLDVRQGSAALVEFPGGKTMLIDGGGYTDNAIFDIGARVLAPFLWGRKILTVDTLVLTHPNSDHLNGLVYIADRFHVGTIWTNGESARTNGYRELMRVAALRKISHPVYAALSRDLKIGGVTVSRLYPPEDFQDRKRTDTWRTVNNNSIVLRVALDGIGFLFAGDLMQRAERELAAMAGGKLKSTVLFVPHHGSKSSSCATFLRTVEPALAIVSAGRGNRFGFPHKPVLKRYKAIGCRVYRTDRHGAIMLSTRGGQLEVETMVKIPD